MTTLKGEVVPKESDLSNKMCMRLKYQNSYDKGRDGWADWAEYTVNFFTSAIQHVYY